MSFIFLKCPCLGIGACIHVQPSRQEFAKPERIIKFISSLITPVLSYSTRCGCFDIWERVKPKQISLIKMCERFLYGWRFIVSWTYFSPMYDSSKTILNSLQRIAEYLSQNTKKIVCNSFILSKFNYWPLVWHICNTKNRQKNEKIQERAVRIILNDYQSDYKALLEASGRELMYISRLKKLACFVYKSW